MHRAALLLFRNQLLNHFTEVDVRPFHPLRRLHHLQHREVLLLHLDLDVALLELPLFQLLAQLLARAAPPLLRSGPASGARRDGGRGTREGGQQQVQEPFLRALLRCRIDVVFAFRADHVDGYIDQLAYHRLDVAADVTHFGELRSFNFEKRGPRDPRQPARDLGFADARRADHDDVVRHDLVPDLFGRLGAAPPVPDRDRDGLLRRFLTNDVAVQLRHDLPWRQFLQPRERVLRAWEGGYRSVGGGCETGALAML